LHLTKVNRADNSRALTNYAFDLTQGHFAQGLFFYLVARVRCHGRMAGLVEAVGRF
jgi:hypothetical protein